MTYWARAAATVVLARPSKRPRHDVWCARIVLHASSLLLSRPATQSQRGGMWQRQRKEKSGRLKAAGKVKSAGGFICLPVGLIQWPGHWRLLTTLPIRVRPVWVRMAAAARGTHQESQFAAVNQYFPPSRCGLFRWQELRNGRALARCAGAAFFSHRPQSETDSRQLVPRLYWLKTMSVAIKHCSNYLPFTLWSVKFVFHLTYFHPL